jgi:hypothetical protein
MLKGKIIKVLEKDNKTPKAQDKWFRDIEYYRDMIVENRSAMLFYDDGEKMTVTSRIKEIKEDENNLILTTENSIYYIKKIL